MVMSGSLLDELRRQALLDAPGAVSVLHDAMREQGELARRYLDGEREQVWEELGALGPAVREPEWAEQAWSIAWETMRRVRRNVEVLLQRYEAAGYRLKSQLPLGAPGDPEQLEALETLAGGPIPLSMRAFWAVVGSLDLRQDHGQTVHDWLQQAPSDLERLGDDDPLYVRHLDDTLEAAARTVRVDDRLYVFFAPDCFHKANVSGGENYHLYLPDPSADFRIVGDVSPERDGQHFVQALRRSLQGGGFRGRLDVRSYDRWMDWRELHLQLGAGLAPL
jgi:hypothetical protein